MNEIETFETHLFSDHDPNEVTQYVSQVFSQQISITLVILIY